MKYFLLLGSLKQFSCVSQWVFKSQKQDFYKTNITTCNLSFVIEHNNGFWLSYGVQPLNHLSIGANKSANIRRMCEKLMKLRIKLFIKLSKLQNLFSILGRYSYSVMEADLLSRISFKTKDLLLLDRDKYTLRIYNTGYRQVTYIVLLVVGKPRLEHSDHKKKAAATLCPSWHFLRRQTRSLKGGSIVVAYNQNY